MYICDNNRYLVCIPYSIENLHIMADDLGIGKHWFHKNNYDIPKRRIDDIQSKCKIVYSRKILNVIKHGTL